jgi:hypothetical protein
MSPWTALLQSLHSAVIDEVTDRHPEPKPELGLPKKQSAFQFPSAQASKLFWVKASFSESTGAVLIAFQEEFFQALGVSVAQFWELIAQRADGEFARRNIAPLFEKRAEFSSPAQTPDELVRLSKVVWIPIELPGGQCWLGIGV